MMTYSNQRNPVLPTDICIPDCEAHIMPDGKLYLYGSYDDNAKDYCSDRYYVCSTTDMETWHISETSFRTQWIPENLLEDRNLGEVDWMHPTPFMKSIIANFFSGKNAEDTDDTGTKSEKVKFLFAPDCIYHKGKYYLYYCTSEGDEGVAEADLPTGPFSHTAYLPCSGIDPAIFVDEDGSPYYLWGQFQANGVRLHDDMTSFDPAEVSQGILTEEEHHFHEGSSLRKIGDLYYAVFSDVERGKPTALGYATAKHPLGPYEYQGIILDNAECDPQSWNNHGSIECFQGQWYIFYHRSCNHSKVHRRLCVEKIQVLPDGTIPEVKMTSQGIGGPFKPGEIIYAFQACGLHGQAYIDLDNRVTQIAPGDEIIFRYLDGKCDFHSLHAEMQGSGKFRILLNDIDVGSISSEQGKANLLMEHLDNANKRDPIFEIKLRCMKADHLELYTLCFQ